MTSLGSRRMTPDSPPIPSSSEWATFTVSKSCLSCGSLAKETPAIRNIIVIVKSLFILIPIELFSEWFGSVAWPAGRLFFAMSLPSIRHLAIGEFCKCRQEAIVVMISSLATPLGIFSGQRTKKGQPELQHPIAYRQVT